MTVYDYWSDVSSYVRRRRQRASKMGVEKAKSLQQQRELELYTTQHSASLRLPRLPDLQNPKIPGPKIGDSGPEVLKLEVSKDRSSPKRSLMYTGVHSHLERYVPAFAKSPHKATQFSWKLNIFVTNSFFFAGKQCA